MRIRVLGPVEIVRAGRLVSAGSPRQRALLALLALSVGVAVPPSRLVDLLWGDSPPPSAGNTVQVYVSRLRRLLAAPGEQPPLRTVSGMYLLDLPPEAIDSRRFEEASESGRARLAAGDPVGAAHELRSALQLWRGSTLPDLAGVPGAAASVARLESLRLSTLADRIDAESLLGRHSRLIPELQDLVRRHALNERFVGQLMTSLYWEGRQAEALAAYAAAAGRLGDELGIDPGPALRDLHGRLLRQEVDPAATALADNVPLSDATPGAGLAGTAGLADNTALTGDNLPLHGTLPVGNGLSTHDAVVPDTASGAGPTSRTESDSKTDSRSGAFAQTCPAHQTPGAHGIPLSRTPGADEALWPETEFSSHGEGGVRPGGLGVFRGISLGRGDAAGGPGLLGAVHGLPLEGSGVGGGVRGAGGPGESSNRQGVLGGEQGEPSEQNGKHRVPGDDREAGSGGAALTGGTQGGGSSRIPGPRSGDVTVSGRDVPGVPYQGRTIPGAYQPDPPNGIPLPPAALPGPPVVPGGPIASVEALKAFEAARQHPARAVVVPRPPTFSVDRGAPVLSGMPDAGGIASIGTKRTAFGAAFGAETVGRAGELAATLDLLRRPDVRLVTIVGPGGAGKTRLAAQVVTRRLAELGRDRQTELEQDPRMARVLVVPLGGTPAGENCGAEPGAGLAARLRRILGVVPDTPNEPPIETVCRALAAVPCLLVLDDLDITDVPPGESDPGSEPIATVNALIARVGGLRVLATSRRTLGVPGEQVIGLGPLPMPWAYSGAQDVHTVGAAEAVQLFRERARAVLPAFEVTEQNADAVSDLCRTLDGLPLALELAAARTRGRVPAEMGRELAAQGVARPRPGSSLDAVLDWTVSLLEDTERLVLSQLSVFVGGATLQAAERVCGPVSGPGQVIDVIGRLADKNLLLIDETGRLGMLAPVREHARRLLATDPAEEAACADRHAAYFAEFADVLPPMTDRWLDPSQGPVAGSSMASSQIGQLRGRAAEYDNLAAAAAHAEERDGEVFARLLTALLDQGTSTGRWELGDAPAWLARAQAQRPTARTGARLLLAGGSLALFGGNPLSAMNILARVPAGATSGEAGAVVAIRVALMRAVTARTLGRSEEALEELGGAVERLKAIRQLPDTLWHAALNTYADVQDDLGRTAQAIGHWQRSRHRAAAGGDPTRLAYPLAMLAQAAQDRGENALARVLIAQARSAAAGGGPAIRAQVAVAGGVLELREGDHSAALGSLRAALRDAHQGGRFFHLPRIVGLLGVAHRQQDPERAAALLATSAAWSAQRSIVIIGRRERELITGAESGLTHAAHPSDAVRRAAARGAAIPFGSLTGLLRIDPVDAPTIVLKHRLIDLTGDLRTTV